MTDPEKVPPPGERARRLRGYLAHQHWKLNRTWSQPQEDAWWLLNELDDLLQFIKENCESSNLRGRLLLERNGKTPRMDYPKSNDPTGNQS